MDTHHFKHILKTKYIDYFDASKKGETRCFTCTRWGGHAILILVDACLDSIGLNYFPIIVPRVQRFWKEYVKTQQIDSLHALSEIAHDDSRLRAIMNNTRCWKAAIQIATLITKMKHTKNLPSEMVALHHWAQQANYHQWNDDVIGRISGVGLVTFQYLRMQVGVDTTIPDRIIMRVAERDFNIASQDPLDFIHKFEAISKATGYSQTFLCWVMWLRESKVNQSTWEVLS